jgi:hypothetical protein
MTPKLLIVKVNEIELHLMKQGILKAGVPLTSHLTGSESVNIFWVFLLNRLIQISQTGGQWYSHTSAL